VLTCYHKLPFTAHQDVSRTRIYKQEISWEDSRVVVLTKKVAK
jgi:hypothetical protein